MNKILTKCIFISSVLFCANSFAGEWKDSTAIKGTQELTGTLDIPTKNKFIATKKIGAGKDGKYMFHLEDPLIANDGNIYAFFMQAIPLLYKNDTDDFLGGKLELYPLPKSENTATLGENAIALKTRKYIYLETHARMSDTDKRIGMIVFWRIPR